MRSVTGCRRAIWLVILAGFVAGCSGGSSGDPSALKAAVGELASVSAPAGAVQDGGGAHGCRRDDWEGDAEPSATADFIVGTQQSAAALEFWYLPRWRDLGWADVANEPGVVERTVDGEAVRAEVQEVGRVGDRFAYTVFVYFATDRCG